jgi:hypothetical protein
MTSKPPNFETTKGRTVTVRDPVSQAETHFVIEDEIWTHQTDSPDKIIILQKCRYADSTAVEYRLGYYIIGKKGRMLGKWRWGRFATFVPVADFQSLVNEAKRRGWLS